ncbi:hypothetical protein ACJO1P_04260 [Vibrio parahaemolyticus]|uniref:hypothetical protein n=1 Tax=Vibrio TaxID=662 RepID=UPI0005F244DB|nr:MULTISPECIES: hypothetical protein [Vibrio]HDY7668784.1 hypothetical protein [Vibrio vulnificus]
MTKNITTPHQVVTADVIKLNVNNVIAMIRKHLKVGCTPSHALDIACAGFIKDYQTLKGLADKNFYVAKANFGTRSNPFIVEREIGFYDSAWFAREAFEAEAEQCIAAVEWQIYCNGEATGIHIQSTPVTEKRGYTLVVEVTGEDETDLEDGLNEVIKNLHCYTGGDRGENRSYSFTKYGEELEPNVFPYTFEEAIIDNNGFLRVSNYDDELEEVFRKIGYNESDIKRWDGDLMLVKWVDIENADDELDYDDECLALDSDGKVVHELEFEDMKQALKNSDEKLHLCVVKDTK